MPPLMENAIAAMIADNQMRQRNDRFESQDKHKAKADLLSDKQPTGQAKPIKSTPRTSASTATTPASAQQTRH